MMIWGYARFPGLERLCSVMDLVNFFEGRASADTEEVTVPLGKVWAWRRGDMVPRLGSVKGVPYIRLTFDARGLREIERVESKPCWSRPPNRAFVMEEADRLSEVTLAFQV